MVNEGLIMFLKKLALFITTKKNMILIIYCLVLLFILGLFTSAYQSFIRNTLYQGVVNNVATITEQGIGNLKSIIDGHFRLIFSYKHYIEENEITFRQAVPSEQRFYIDGILEHNRYQNTCVVMPSGLASCYDGTNMDVSEQLCFTESMKGLNCVSTPFMDVAGEKLVSITAPLAYLDGTVGVLMITTYLAHLYESFNISFYDDQGYSYILDNEGNVIIDSVKRPVGTYFMNVLTYLEDNGNDLEQIDQIRSDMKNGFSGVTLINSAGIRKFMSFKPFDLNGSKLYFAALVSEAVVLQNEKRIMFYTTLLCILATMVAMGVVIYIIIIRRRQQYKTFRLAYFDNETGLYNKNYMDGFFHKITAEKGVNYASVAVDINNFKIFNHLHGYERGAYILRVMGDVFLESLEHGETAARMTNDIFFIILKYEKQSRLVVRMTDMIEKIRQELKSNPDLINSRITFACGLFLMQDKEETSAANVFDNADIARQKTKGTGKTWITFFRKSMITQLKSEQAIENIMETALRNDEFIVYLQPKIDFSTLQVMGAEALVRWKRAEHGIVSPATFIPVFERTGFITQLDFYVFEKTCIALSEWRKAGKMLDIIISVNMSRNHLGQDYFIDVLSLIANRWGIPLNSLEIEITESAFFEDSAHLIKILHKLKSVGFRLSMDDFGAGYSSLNLLKQIPVDVLKIDKEFLDQSGVSEKGRVIISSIIHMAKCIDVEVVCEGVETEEQATFLRNMGCDYAQGYLYAKPMSLQDFYDFVIKVNGEESKGEESYHYYYGANI